MRAPPQERKKEEELLRRHMHPEHHKPKREGSVDPVHRGPSQPSIDPCA